MAKYLRKLKFVDLRNECPKMCALQGLIYMRASWMHVYAGLANYVLYASIKSTFRQNGSLRMIAVKIT